MGLSPRTAPLNSVIVLLTLRLQPTFARVSGRILLANLTVSARTRSQRVHHLTHHHHRR